MAFNQEQFDYRCEVVRTRRRNGNNPRESTTILFSDIQMAYIWIKEDIGFEIPQDRNVSQVGNYECLSFHFTTDVLNMNFRREGFEFGVRPVVSPTMAYTIYYVPDGDDDDDDANANANAGQQGQQEEQGQDQVQWQVNNHY